MQLDRSASHALTKSQFFAGANFHDCSIIDFLDCAKRDFAAVREFLERASISTACPKRLPSTRVARTRRLSNASAVC